MEAPLRRRVTCLLAVVAATALVSLSAPSGFLAKEWRLVNVPLHAAIEALGGLAAILIGLFLLQRQVETYGAKRFPLAIGFLGMGLLDSLHGISTPGDGFVLLHTAAGLVGGGCFALVWLPDRWIRSRWFAGLAATTAVVTAAWALAAFRTLPVMIRGEAFTATAVGVNFLAGVLFLVGAIRLLLEFRWSERAENRLLAYMAALFGFACLLFNYSSMWDHTCLRFWF